MCVRLSELPDLRPAPRNRLSITPAVPIDRLGNQQLSPSDQSRRGEEGGGKGEVGGSPHHHHHPLTLTPLLSAQERLHSAGVRLARGWAHWWRLTPA